MREEPPDTRSVFEELSKATAKKEGGDSDEPTLDSTEGSDDIEREFEQLLRPVREVLQTEDVQFDETIVKENLDEILLMLIALRGETHGKELLSDLSELFDSQLSPGTVYPSLHTLEDEDVLSMHTKIRTKEYSIADEGDVQSVIEESMVQHLAFGLVMYAFLSRSKTISLGP